MVPPASTRPRCETPIAASVKPDCFACALDTVYLYPRRQEFVIQKVAGSFFALGCACVENEYSVELFHLIVAIGQSMVELGKMAQLQQFFNTRVF
jgi:hypothetical protein